MVRIARKSDGRRIFTAEFRHEQISRVFRGELTIAELSRKLRIAPGLLQRWKRHRVQEGTVATVGRAIALPVTELQAAQAHIRELERLVGRQAVELAGLRTSLDVARRGGRPEKAHRR
jgi:transposase-like protein